MNIGHCVLSHQIIKRKGQTWFLWGLRCGAYSRAALIKLVGLQCRCGAYLSVTLIRSGAY